MKLAMWLKVAAEIPLGLLAAVSLFMGSIEILRGNFYDGAWTLLGVGFFGALVLLAWKSPLGTGFKLVIGGILFLALSMMGRNPDEGLDEFIMGGTALMIGVLLLLSTWVTPKAPK